MFPIRMRSAAQAVGLLLVTSALSQPHAARAQQTAVPAVTKAQSTAALAGAHQALLGLANSKRLPEAAGYLTDRSAGALGFLFAIPIAIVVSMSTAGSTPDHPSPDPTLPQDFTQFATRYFGDSDSTKAPTDFPATFKGHEREFIQGLIGFNTRLGKLHKNADALKFSQPMFTGLSQYKTTVLSPTDVHFRRRKPDAIKLSGVKTLHAIQENGQWRIDLGDPVAIVNAVEDSKPNPPAKKRDPMEDDMIDAVRAHNTTQIKALLHINPKLVEAKDNMGESALYNAVFEDDIPTANFLIAHGAQVNAPNEFGETALNEAMFFEKADMVALLKKHGGKLGIKTKNAFEFSTGARN